LFQYDIFISRLNDDDRPVPDSLLSGVRLAVKPAPWLELGASRAMHFGGEGKEQGFSAWWESVKGLKDNDPGFNGNQLGGFEASVLIPLKFQTVKFYIEMAGEDQARGHIVPFPSKWAVVSGVFFPTIGRNARWDFRVEIATNQIRGKGPAWYVHGSSAEGYAHRYRGQILGHHMGTDARDLFLEAHYFLLPSSYLEANIDFTQRDFPGPEREETWRVSGAIVAWLTKNLRAEGRLAFESVSNENGVAGKDETDAVFQAALSYQYR
jgi:hypothetical protein